MDPRVESGSTKHGAGRAKPSKRKSPLPIAALIAIVLCFAGAVALTASDDPEPSNAQPQATAPIVTRPPTLSNVSLTFDSGTAAQMTQARTVIKYGLHGTFFINSGFVGADGYMSRNDLQELANAGQEIGGHTVTLADLSVVGADEAKRQVCDDRVNLNEWGFKVSSFSYPFGKVTPEAQKIVMECGYNSARSTGTVLGKFGCDGCAAAETVIPQDVFATRATANIDGRWSLADLQAAVTDSEATGSWLQLVFGVTEDSPDKQPINAEVFEAFCAWLGDRTAHGTSVRTVHEMIGKKAGAVVAGPVKAPAPPGVNALQNPDLETPGAWNLPQCWQSSSYGKNTPWFSKLAPAPTGSTGANLQVTDYESGDAKVLPTLDLGECAPSVIVGHTYTLGASLTSTERTQIELYVRDKVGKWTYWTASPYYPAGVDPIRYSWVTPPVPEGAVALSFGFNLFSNGVIVTDDYTMYDTTGEIAQ
ncbi:hypothetical protein MB46_02515 [Arthrobacter alpinus]|uniref:polysaccharide deacetylase family protein n=1 Tax=Arthrobacter alpinus TaxID=656366 RepID=UPI0005CABF3B|nr:hypothetical protein MB46_02515 [Arthrobacter alpinus]